MGRRTFLSIPALAGIFKLSRKRYGLVDSTSSNPAACFCTPYLNGKVVLVVLRGNDVEGWLDVCRTEGRGWSKLLIVDRVYGDVRFEFNSPEMERLFLSYRRMS